MQSGDDDLLHFSLEGPAEHHQRLLNRELWLRDDYKVIEVRPHDPATGMRHVLSVNYVPDATCPEFDAAVEGYSKRRISEDLITFLDELWGTPSICAGTSR